MATMAWQPFWPGAGALDTERTAKRTTCLRKPSTRSWAGLIISHEGKMRSPSSDGGTCESGKSSQIWGAGGNRHRRTRAPDPAEGEVLVHVFAAAVGPWDALIRERNPHLPAIHAQQPTRSMARHTHQAVTSSLLADGLRPVSPSPIARTSVPVNRRLTPRLENWKS